MNGTARRVMLLIDADNVSADVIEQALERTLAEYGAVHIRRAYSGIEKAAQYQALFKRLSVRPMVNLSTGKNSTDIALAVDALDLAVAERPDVVVLVSSDSDFAPLVIRLREKGCRVCGIGQQGKTGEDTSGAYDEFTDLKHHSAPAPTARVVMRSPRRVKSTPVVPAAPPLPEDVQEILNTLPELAHGERIELNSAAVALRAAKLLGRNASSLKLFRKHPELFALEPAGRPSKVQYTGPRR